VSGATRLVESDPEQRVDLSGVVISEVDHRVLFTMYEDSKPRRYFKAKEFQKEYAWLTSQLQGKEIGLASRSSDENLWILGAYSDTDPGTAYLWNRKAKSLTLQYQIREELPRASLSLRKPYDFRSSDGLLIHASLTVPKGLPAKNLPLIVWPHGGPWARDNYGYDTYAQFLANRGYAVLQPNFRASTGYGKRFLNAANGEWGRKMQDDLTW
jgi:dipeptidyl aminopeptidase/acylaminoacyl peptidase